MHFEDFYTHLGGAISIPIPYSYLDCVELIKSDYYRIYGRKENLIKVWFKTIRNRSLKYLFFFFFSAYRGVFFPFCRIKLDYYGKKYAIDIPPQTKIGFGLYIAHGMSIVVNKTAVIGNNVNLSQMVNIGSNHNHAAMICDNVYIGPQVCIVEDVQIGKNSLIGCGSIVTHDIPANQTAVGSPCKVIGSRKHNYIKNPWSVQ